MKQILFKLNPKWWFKNKLNQIKGLFIIIVNLVEFKIKLAIWQEKYSEQGWLINIKPEERSDFKFALKNEDTTTTQYAHFICENSTQIVVINDYGRFIVIEK